MEKTRKVPPDRENFFPFYYHNMHMMIAKAVKKVKNVNILKFMMIKKNSKKERRWRE
jgi:hypothetical protein